MQSFQKTTWLVLLLAVGIYFIPEQQAKAAPISITISPSSKVIFSQVRIRRRRWKRIRRQNWDFKLRVWVRKMSGWTKLRTYTMSRRKWVKSISKRRVCRGVMGKTRLAIQVGIFYKNWWWNRDTRKWQRNFLSVRQELHTIQCGNIADDLPPGSPTPTNGPPQNTPDSVAPPANSLPPRTHAPPQTGTVPGDPEGHHHGTNDHHGTNNHHGTTTTPPPPATIGRGQFRGYLRSFKKLSFDRNRLRSLKNWTSRLNGLKLKAWMVRRLMKEFSFSKGKIRAARRLSRHILAPIKTRHLRRIISTFSFDQYKLKAALYFCRRGIADPLNLHKVSGEFSFSSYKNKFLKRCH